MEQNMRRALFTWSPHMALDLILNGFYFRIMHDLTAEKIAFRLVHERKINFFGENLVAEQMKYHKHVIFFREKRCWDTFVNLFALNASGFI